MDKTVEIVVVAMVALVTGLAILYLATGQAEGFGGFADGQQESAQCNYYEERISRACPDEADSLEEQAPEECTIEATPKNCPDDETSNPEEPADTGPTEGS
jgi:hypothetical protein